MRHIKIIFSDIDGTLLDGKRELAMETTEEIKRVSAKYGLPFVMVSARTPSGLQHLYNQLNSADPAICFNGALILSHLEEDNLKHLTLSSTSIDYQAVKWMHKKANELQLHSSFFSEDTWVTDERDYWTIREENNTKTNALITNSDIYLTGMFKENKPVHKVMIMGDLNILDIYEQESRNTLSEKVNIYRSKETYLEISPKSVTKATACKFILNRLGISPQDALAFGDNYNDTEMLKMVGAGVAMDNAPDAVKKVANFIAPSNKANGVATILKSYFP